MNLYHPTTTASTNAFATTMTKISKKQLHPSLPEKKKGQKPVGKKSTSNLCLSSMPKRNMFTVNRVELSSDRKKTV